MRKLKLQELGRVSIESFKHQEKTPIVLVLDNVRSALNVGSAFRTADGFALEKIVLCGITAQPPHREILKTAIGATDSMEWVYYEDVTKALNDLQKENFQIIAVEQAENSTALQDYKIPENQKVALIFGNEVNGVSEAAMEKVDACIEVPQYGTKHSFNISVCIGIVVWDLFKKLRFC